MRYALIAVVGLLTGCGAHFCTPKPSLDYGDIAGPYVYRPDGSRYRVVSHPSGEDATVRYDYVQEDACWTRGAR